MRLLTSEKQFAMKSLKAVVKKAEAGLATQMEILLVMNRVHFVDARIIEAAIDETKTQMQYDRDVKTEFRDLLQRQSWEP